MLIYNIFHLSAQIVYISQLFPTCGDNDALKPGPRVVRRLTMVEKLQRWITVNFELSRCLVGGIGYLQLSFQQFRQNIFWNIHHNVSCYTFVSLVASIFAKLTEESAYIMVMVMTFAQKMTKVMIFCMTKDEMIYLFEHFCSLFVFWFQRLAMPTPRIACLQNWSKPWETERSTSSHLGL